MDSTIKLMLNRYTQRDHYNDRTNSDPETGTQLLEQEQLQVEVLFAKYEEKDNESPETETESQIESNGISGSEEIQYGNPDVNRENLPKI